MADENRHEERQWDEALRAAFEGNEGAPGDGDRDDGGESVLERLERSHGTHARVSLRDLAHEPSPIVRLTPPDGEAGMAGDDRYEVVGEIARGGVGVVFQGRDKDLGRDVALKMLRQELSDRPEIVARFVEEAQIGGQLQHPGIVPVFGLGLQADGRPTFAMKLVKGRTLSALLAERPDTDESRRRFLRIFEQICETVAYAHARGVVHRDLKSANVMLGAFGEVQVVDWGLAKVLTEERRRPETASDPGRSIIATVRTDSEGSASRTGSVMGTPAYMPPEQALGYVEELDERADVFALGAILTEILTGAPPYVGTPTDRLESARAARLDDALGRLEGCGAAPELVHLARSCLAPEREKRPRHAGEVAGAITSHLSEVEDRARRAEIEAAEARAIEAEERDRAARERLAKERDRALAEHEHIETARVREEERIARERAEWERDRRRRTRLLAATVLLGVLLAGGSLAFYFGEARERAETLTAAVTERLRKARSYADRDRWAEAVELAEANVETARGGDDRLLTRAREVRGEIVEARRLAIEEAGRAGAVARLVDDVAAIWARGARTDRDERERELAEAFGRFASESGGAGLPAAIGKVHPEEGADVAVALDYWATLGSRSTGSEDPRALARRLDSDLGRERIRGALDDDGMIIDLADGIDAASFRSVDLALLGRLLLDAGEIERAAKLLKAAPARDSGSLWLALSDGAAARVAADEIRAARLFTAAHALRPSATGILAERCAALVRIGESQEALGEVRATLDRQAKMVDAGVAGAAAGSRAILGLRAARILPGTGNAGDLEKLPEDERVGWRIAWERADRLVRRAEEAR